MQSARLSHLPIDGIPAEEPILRPLLGGSTERVDESTSPESCPERDGNTVSIRTVAFWLLLSIALCIVCTSFTFGKDIPPYLVIVAVAVAFPLCLIAFQSTGETDTVPSNGLSKAPRRRLIPQVC